MGEVKGPLQTAVELGKGCPLYGRDRLLTFYSIALPHSPEEKELTEGDPVLREPIETITIP